MELLPYLPVILLLLAVEGFFSGAEMAIVACDKTRIKNDANAGSRGAKMLEGMLEKPEWLLGTTLVGTNLAEVFNTILVTFLMIERFDQKGEFYAILAMVPIILFWAEILPKTFFQQKADVLAPRVVYVLWLASRCFYPILWLLATIPRSKTSGPDGIEREALQREDLKRLVSMQQKGSDILAEERKMVDRLIELSSKKVEEVMIPLIDVVALPETATRDQAVGLVLEKGHSRLPVFRDRVVRITGVLHHFDLLLTSDRSQNVASLARPPFFVPETKQVFELLLYMKKSGNNMAIAVDEYGGATGVITVEDILEEIVGEIEDEYDRKRSFYKKIGPNSYRLDARIEIEDLNERFSCGIPEGDYETLGGFLITRFGRILQEGDVFRQKNLIFTVEEATPRAVQRVRLDIL